MSKFQIILIGATLDERDATTVQYAAQIARSAGSSVVHFVHVSPDDPPVATGDNSEVSDHEIERKLRELVDRSRDEFPPSIVFRMSAVRGHFLQEMTRLASQLSADLFCLSRRQSPDGDTLSDRAIGLVRYLPCSVLVAPPKPPEFECIMTPVDFSDHSREALEAACEIAASCRAHVAVEHVYEVPMGWHKSGHSFEEFAALMRRNSEQDWERFARGTATRGVTLSTRFDLSDNVPRAILNAADEVNAGLIVMGSHGRTRSAAFLLGHVADRICEGTNRAVLCVKKKGEVVTLLKAILQLF